MRLVELSEQGGVFLPFLFLERCEVGFGGLEAVMAEVFGNIGNVRTAPFDSSNSFMAVSFVMVLIFP